MYVGERFADAGINLIFGQAHIAGAECHILIDRFGKQLVFGVLEYHADVAASAVCVFAVCQIFAVPEHASFGGVCKAVQVLYQGGFTRPRMSCNGKEFAIVEGEADIAQGVALHFPSFLLSFGERRVAEAYLFESDRHSSSFSVAVSI